MLIWPNAMTRWHEDRFFQQKFLLKDQKHIVNSELNHNIVEHVQGVSKLCLVLRTSALFGSKKFTPFYDIKSF